MTANAAPKKLTMLEFFGLFFKILKPEKNFYWLAIIYGVGISLLSLATPISVQMLINTVANTALAAPLILLSATLFGLLIISGLLNALRIHLMELFGRRFYARMVAEISLRSIYAQNPFFDDLSRSALFNRYFDIVGVQKAIPVIFIGGFTILLQASVGFILVSFYHPLFIVFNLILIALIWVVWLVWGSRAIRSAINLSHSKHNTAAWLETLGTSDGFFKSQKRIEYALDRTDKYTHNYMENYKTHFRHHYAQTLSFLFIYAAASATLLGLGGWLVIQGELSLGQLVAAELILSAAFFGVSQLGTYLTYFYDLCAAAEELSLFYDVEQEEPKGTDPIASTDHKLVFNNLRSKARNNDVVLDFEVPSSMTIMASASNHGIQRLFADTLKQHAMPEGGFATIGGIDLSDIDVHHLRQNIYVINRSSFINMTIREYLRLSCDEGDLVRIMGALETVGLSDVIASFEDGLDTEIASTGWPLSAAETLKLKLANAIISKPRILVINQLFDLLYEENLANAIAALRATSETTVVYFSNRRIDLGFDKFLHMENDKQTYYETFDEFCLAAHGHPANISSNGRLLTPAGSNQKKTSDESGEQ